MQAAGLESVEVDLNFGSNSYTLPLSSSHFSHSAHFSSHAPLGSDTAGYSLISPLSCHGEVNEQADVLGSVVASSSLDDLSCITFDALLGSEPVCCTLTSPPSCSGEVNEYAAGLGSEGAVNPSDTSHIFAPSGVVGRSQFNSTFVTPAHERGGESSGRAGDQVI